MTVRGSSFPAGIVERPAAAALTLLGAAAGAGVTHLAWHRSPTSASGPGTRQAGPLAPAAGRGDGDSGAAGAVHGGDTVGGSAADGPTDAAAIARRVDAGVVDITTSLGYAGGQAAGTGMVVTADGEVLTNNHVIAGATAIRVTDVGNGRTDPATVVGYDRGEDVAVLQLRGASGLSTITPATAAVAVGQAVVGVGNAGGRGGTPSFAGGTVTATGRSITATDSGDGTREQLTGLIETDAPIVAGDSGGPLAGVDGRVVGMDTAASSAFRFSGSQGYAIPIATVLRLAGQIEAGAASPAVHIGPTAMLGVEVASRAAGDDPGADATAGNGALVAGVLPGGPAAVAGIEPGQEIVRLDGHAVPDADTLARLMATEQPGRTVAVTVVTGSGADRSVRVTLTAGPPQ